MEHKYYIDHNGLYQYPFKNMELGDYFVIKAITQARAASIGACAWHHWRKHGKKFSRVKIDDGTWKVTRIE